MRHIHSMYKIALVVVLLSTLAACGAKPPPAKPEEPRPPKSVWETVTEATVTPLSIDYHRTYAAPISKTATFAIIDFRDMQHTQGTAGAMVADRFIIDLKNRGFRVIDRERIDKIVQEQALMSEGRVKLSDIELARRIGELVHADFFLFGAVTDWDAALASVPLGKVILRSDIPRYEEESREYENLRPEYEKECERYTSSTKLPCPPMPRPKTVDDWDDYFATERARQVLAPVARVGLTAKVIEVRSSNIVWVGQANVADSNLLEGVKRISNAMINSVVDAE